VNFFTDAAGSTVASPDNFTAGMSLPREIPFSAAELLEETPGNAPTAAADVKVALQKARRFMNIAMRLNIYRTQ
jgi:hypothetical protein